MKAVPIDITRTQLVSETKRILSDYNLKAFKSYSQHFAIEPNLIRWLINYADLKESDTVVEVGAGLGILTKFLAEKVQRVIAVEYDLKLIEVLENELTSFSNIEILALDILKTEQIFDGAKIVANPPYQISSPLTFKIIQSAFNLSVMSYQKEFAERMVAKTGTKKYGRLTVGVNYYADVEYLRSIPRSYFYPMPKIDSALVRLKPHKHPFELSDEKDFFEFIRVLFSFRNKSVRRALTLYLKQADLLEIQEMALQNLPLSDERIFRLSLDDFYLLYQKIADCRQNKIGN